MLSTACDFSVWHWAQHVACWSGVMVAHYSWLVSLTLLSCTACDLIWCHGCTQLTTSQPDAVAMHSRFVSLTYCTACDLLVLHYTQHAICWSLIVHDMWLVILMSHTACDLLLWHCAQAVTCWSDIVPSMWLVGPMLCATCDLSVWCWAQHVTVGLRLHTACHCWSDVEHSMRVWWCAQHATFWSGIVVSHTFWFVNLTLLFCTAYYLSVWHCDSI